MEGLPLIDVAPLAQGESDPFATHTAHALRSYLLWCKQVLDAHPLNRDRLEQGLAPVNGIVTQRPGQWREVEPFSRRWGLKGVSVASGLVYWGICQFLGMDVHKVQDGPDAGLDLAERLQWAMAHRDEYEFFHIHSKTPDAAAHTKDPHAKVRVIESLDRGLGRVMDDLHDNETVVVVTADHSTPSGGPQIHSGEDVPFMVIGPGIRRDTVCRFDEVSCGGGLLGRIHGADFMYMVLNWLDRAKLAGLMDTPDDQPYWPGIRNPFRLEH